MIIRAKKSNDLSRAAPGRRPVLSRRCAAEKSAISRLISSKDTSLPLSVIMGNISYRIGAESSNEQIKEVIQGDKDSLEAFERFQGHLAANGVNLKQTPAILGPWLKMNSSKERFIGKFSKRANKLLARDYRKPFVVPEQV